MSLGPHVWMRLKEVFDGARSLPPDARPAFLRGACRDDEALRLEVEKLLASHEAAAGFLETPAGFVEDTAAATNLKGQRLGAYHIGHRIGAGGMGEVFRAIDTRLNRPVAIKSTRARTASKFVAGRPIAGVRESGLREPRHLSPTRGRHDGAQSHQGLGGR